MLLLAENLASGASSSGPPVARTQPVAQITHNFVRQDNYTWLRDESRENSEVLEYLQAEEDFYAESLASETLRASQIRAALTYLESFDVPAHPPYRDRSNSYQYVIESPPDSEDQVLVRRPVPQDAGPLEEDEAVFGQPGELVLNSTKLANLSTIRVSPTHGMVAYTYESGPDSYTLKIDDVATGNPSIMRPITGVCDQFAWSADSSVIFYAALEEDYLACHQIIRHVLGTDPVEDVVTFGEPDVSATTIIQEEDEYLFLVTGSVTANSIYVIRRSAPYDTWQPLFLPQPEITVSVDEAQGRAILQVVDRPSGSITFHYISAPMLQAISEGLRHDLRHFPIILRKSLDVSYLDSGMKGRYSYYVKDVKFQRSIVVHKFSPNDSAGYSQEWLVVDLGSSCGAVEARLSGSDEDVVLHVTTSSPVEISKIVEYSLKTRSSAIVSEAFHPNVDMGSYVQELTEVEANDGVRIPMLLFYRRDAVLMDGSSPTLINFYGAYGISSWQGFSSQNLMLADQGFVLAFAYIRGGGELGESWHERGRLLNRKVALTDLILCMDEVVRLGYTSRDRLALWGSSAGGTAVTALANMVPGAFRVGLARKPFTDVLGSLLEEKLALSDWSEFGNPRNATVFEYILSYSPYDNIRKQNYPHLLLTTALDDTRVRALAKMMVFFGGGLQASKSYAVPPFIAAYWDPAKFVAKLRAHKTDKNMLFLSTYKEGGHSAEDADKDVMHICFLFKALGLEWKNAYPGMAVPEAEAQGWGAVGKQ